MRNGKTERKEERGKKKITTDKIKAERRGNKA